MTSSANATFSYAVRLGSRRKSWNTHPIERRKCGTFHDRMVVTSLVFTTTLPRVGATSCSRSLMIVDLPEREGPMKKTNSPFSMPTLTSSSDGRDALGYVFVTFSSRITGTQSTRCNENANPGGYANLHRPCGNRRFGGRRLTERSDAVAVRGGS